MALAIQFQAAQAAAGAPLSLSGSTRAATVADDTASGWFFGETASSTPPATFADLLHPIGGGISASGFDACQTSFAEDFSGGVISRYVDQIIVRLLKRLDGNYVAGHYVWFAAFGAASPAGGAAPVGISAPFLIS